MPDELLLGLATTQQLLDELSIRFQMANYDDGYEEKDRKDIHQAQVRVVHINSLLPERMLAYRTVDT